MAARGSRKLILQFKIANTIVPDVSERPNAVAYEGRYIDGRKLEQLVIAVVTAKAQKAEDSKYPNDGRDLYSSRTDLGWVCGVATGMRSRTKYMAIDAGMQKPMACTDAVS